MSAGALDRRPGARFAIVVLCLVAAEMGQADEAKPGTDKSPDLPRSPVAASPAGKPLDLLLTQAELRLIVRNYELRTGEVLTAPIDDNEVDVIAPRVLAPMRDVSQDIAGGIAAPFWAIMHPKDAWRIFVPIPPKGRQEETERPAPDPR